MEKNKNDAKIRYRQELDRQIKMFGEMADHGNGYAREYQDYLVALRDDTLSETEKRAGPRLIFNQRTADHAFEILSVHITCMRRDTLEFVVERFSKWGASRGPRSHSRYTLLSPIFLAACRRAGRPIQKGSDL